MSDEHQTPEAEAGTTLVVLVVDRSGSMESIRDDMEGGIRTLLKEQAEEPGTCVVTLAQFDTEYELLFQSIPAAEVTYDLVPRGGTALLDAIGRTIVHVRHTVEAQPEPLRPAHVVFAVVTDGLENSSVEWTKAKVLDAVKQASDTGWQFTFLGANQDAIAEGGGMGFGRAGSMTYDASSAGVTGAMSAMSASVRRLRRGIDPGLSYTEEERRQSGAG
jgi:Mg-chelatase subunit ChlD